jgi:hypothetical protein
MEFPWQAKSLQSSRRVVPVMADRFPCVPLALADDPFVQNVHRQVHVVDDLEIVHTDADEVGSVLEDPLESNFRLEDAGRQDL